MSVSKSPVLASWNGELSSLDDLHVPILDRSYFFGDAAYEALRIYSGKVWLKEEHFARLARTLQGLRINSDLLRLHERMFSTLGRSGVQEAILYCQISRGAARRAHAFPKPAVTANELIYIEPLSSDPFASLRESGIATITHEDLRWGRRDLKTVNLLPNCLARQQAFERDCQEAILVETDGRVTEATSANVFIVDKGRLVTAPNGNQILPGITRGFVLGLARELGLVIEETFFSRHSLEQASEVFLTSTSAEVLPVTRIDGRAVANGVRGPVTTQLHDAFRDAVARFTLA